MRSRHPAAAGKTLCPGFVLACLLLAPAAAPAQPAGGATQWGSITASLAGLGYRDGLSLEGSAGERDLYFPVPPGVEARGAQLVFELDFGELLVAQSAVSFRVNGTARRAVRRGEHSPRQRVEIPLTARDLEARYVHVALNYTLFLDRDACFSRKLAGAYVNFAPDGGLALQAADGLPRTVRAAWSMLPRDVTVAARLSQELSADEFQALLRVATLLHREGHRVSYEALAEGQPTRAHIVIAPGGGEPAGNLRVVHSREPGTDRAYLLVDASRPLPAADLLQLPWRHVAGAAQLDAAAAAAWPPAPDADTVLRLRDLGFEDSERSFIYSAEWQIALPFGAMGNARRPSRAVLQLQTPPLGELRRPTILSAYFNGRLVHSAALQSARPSEAYEFELPALQLRARNHLRVLAQRDEISDDCARVAAAYPLSISPLSVIETSPLNDPPATFAEMVPHQHRLELHVARSALAQAGRAVPLLVAMSDHFWPDVPPPPVRLFEPGADPQPAGPFFVLGDAGWKAEALVELERGRVRVRSNATGEALMLLDVATDAGLSVLQMARAGGHSGAWLRTTGDYLIAPPRSVLFEDENVAFLGPQGVQAALRIGSTRDYRVDYPEAKSWYAASGAWRTAIFVIAWLLVAALLMYLYLRTRRHRGN